MKKEATEQTKKTSSITFTTIKSRIVSHISHIASSVAEGMTKVAYNILAAQARSKNSWRRSITREK